MGDVSNDSIVRPVVDAPASSTELQSAVAEAFATSTKLRIVGGDSWRTAGRPVAAGRDLVVGGMRGVIEYVPGDLVITVAAGTTLAEIAEVTAANDQWLALDPAVSQAGLTRATIGATIATASHGPLAMGYGRVRDLVLGLTCVSGNGQLVRAGGRVVKNVAGFDLVRLVTGSWGTLGVISEVSLRLHARPRVDATFAVTIDWPAHIDGQTAALSQLATRVNDRAMLPTMSALAALALFTHGAPRYLSTEVGMAASSGVLLARVMGNQTRVDAVRTTLSTLGDVTELSSDVWRAVRTSDQGDIAWRLTDAPTRSADTWRTTHNWLADRGLESAHVMVEPTRGAVRISADSSRAAAMPIATMWSLPTRGIPECLPASAWPRQSPPTADEISQRIRRAFDPAHLLNHGMFDNASDNVESATAGVA